MLDALSDFRRTWPQLILTELIWRAVAIVVIGPLVGLLALAFLSREDHRVLTDAEIASFLLHPLGLAALLVVGGVTLGVIFARLGLLLVIGFGATEDRRLTYLDAFRYVGARATHFVHLAASMLLRLILATAPFLAAIGGIYLLLLGEYDINYYLAEKPPEFRRALVLAGLAGAGLALVVLRLVADWILAVPMLLFEDTRGRAALRRSRQVIGPYRWRVVLFLLAWGVAVVLASALLSYLIGRVGGLLIPDWNHGWVPAAVGLGATLLLAGLATLTLQVVTDSLLPLLIVRGYRRLVEHGTLGSGVPERGSLGARATLQVPGKAWLIALLLAPLLGLGLAFLIVRDIGREDTAWVIAHRGAAGGAPENTMAAFELAYGDGADWIELDVQEDAQGQVIVAHDSDFMRQAGVQLPVWEATAERLADLDVGSSFDPRFADQRVPSLRQVLTWARDRIGVVIELKYYGHDEQLEQRVATIVEDTGMQSDVMLMSLDRAGLSKMAGLRPDWTAGLLNTASVGDLTRLEVDFLALNSTAATRAQIRRAHARGMQVYVWTLDDPIQMSVMLSRGADGIITNEPGLARKVLELRAELSPLGRIIVWAAGETGLLRDMAEASGATDA